jgi:hypothetical protein
MRRRGWRLVKVGLAQQLTQGRAPLLAAKKRERYLAKSVSIPPLRLL